MRITPMVRRAAADTAQLASVFGSECVADEVIAAAVNRHERVVMDRIIAQAREAAVTSAMDLDAGVAYILSWFADELSKDLGPDGQPASYYPADGDCVQVTLTGVLSKFTVTHPSTPDQTVWELDSNEGIILPLTEDDFETLNVVRILGGGEDA